MAIRSVVLILCMPILAAGCAAQQHQQQLAACEAQSFRTQVQRVTCINNAEVGRTFPAIRAQRHSMRLALAAQVDAGEITQAQADEQFSRYIQQIQAEHAKRHNATSAVQGALIGAGFR